MIDFGKTKSDKLKLLWTLFACVAYMAIGVVVGGNSLMIIGSMLTIVAILNFAHRTTLSIILFTLVELCNVGMVIGGYGTTKAASLLSPELLVLSIGSIINLVYIGYRIKRDKVYVGETLSNRAINFILYKTKPIRLKFIFQVMLYSIIVTVCMAVASGLTQMGDQEITMLTSIWIVMPTFYTLATVLRLSNMYILRMMAQVVYLIVVYMRFSLGQADYVGAVSSSLILITLIIGYVEFKISTTNGK